MIMTPPTQQRQQQQQQQKLWLLPKHDCYLQKHQHYDYSTSNDNNEDSENNLNNDHQPPLVRSIYRNHYHHHHLRQLSFHSSTTALLTWKFFFDRFIIFILRRRRWPIVFLLLLLLVVVEFFCSSSSQTDIRTNTHPSTSRTTNDRTIHENTIFGMVHAYTLTTTTTTTNNNNNNNNNNILVLKCDRHHLSYFLLHNERPRITLPLFATYKTNRYTRDGDDDGDSKISPNIIPPTPTASSITTENTTPTAVVVVLGIRLNKVFTKWYSRRSADTLIRDGRIQVNDEIVTDLGRRVIPYRDIIRLDSEIYHNWEEHITTTIDDSNHNNNNNMSSSAAMTQKQQQQSVSSSSSSFVNAESNSNEIITTSTTTGSRLDNMEHDENDEQDHPLPPHHPTTDAHVYIKYWKPVGVISTTDRNVPNNLIDAIYHGVTSTTATTSTTTRENQNHIQRHPPNPNVQQLQNGRRIFNVGRLDKDSSGLLLLTSDGRVPNIVLSKQFVHTKVYYVVLDKPITYEHIQQLRRGILITTDTIRQRKHTSYTAKTLPCQVEPLYNVKNDNSDTKRRRFSETDLWYNNDTIEASSSSSSSSSSSYIPTTELQITLIEGRNRQIRIMLQSVGSYRVLELHRTQFMSTIDLTNLHHPGDWTYLNTTELTSLQRAITSSSSSLQRGLISNNNDTLIRQQSSKSLLW